MVIKCLRCGKEKKTYLCRIKIGFGKFCSKRCANIYNNTGKKNPMYGRRGKLAPAFGKKGEKSFNWNGGKKRERGYVLVLVPNHPFSINGYVREHRLVMEKKLGRFLDPKEIIHHINHVKDDNREENLMLYKNNGEHLKGHFPKGNDTRRKK